LTSFFLTESAKAEKTKRVLQLTICYTDLLHVYDTINMCNRSHAVERMTLNNCVYQWVVVLQDIVLISMNTNRFKWQFVFNRKWHL